MHSYLVDRFGDLTTRLDHLDARLVMNFVVSSVTTICTQWPLNLHPVRMRVNEMHRGQEHTAGTILQVSSRQNCSSFLRVFSRHLMNYSKFEKDLHPKNQFGGE